MFICDECCKKMNVSDFEKTFGLRSNGKCECCGEKASRVDSHHYEKQKDKEVILKTR